MKKKLKELAICLAVMFVTAGTYWYADEKNEYLKYKPRTVVVEDKMQLCGRNCLLYAIAREERGIRFEIPVSISDYNSIKIGKHYVFNLREMDIRQTTRDNAIWFFGFIVFTSFCLVIFGASFVMFVIILFVRK